MKKFTVLIGALVASLGLLATAVPAHAADLLPTDGFDVAWPQCNGSLNSVAQAPGAFSVIDINGGKVFTVNDCVVDQLKWAANGNSQIQLYANTGNPGGPWLWDNTVTQHGSTYQVTNWPSRAGKTKQRPCTTSTTFTNQSNCSYDYGWNAARDSYAKAVQAFKDAGLTYTPKSVNWWLDLESTNTWRGHDPEYTHPADAKFTSKQLNDFNVQAMRGQHDYLVNVAKVKQLGFYGSPNEWQTLLSGTQTFADHPFWYPIGQDTNDSARATCANYREVSGVGQPAMVQYVDAGLSLDMSVKCDPQSTLAYKGTTSVRRGSAFTLTAKLTATSSGRGLHGQTVSFTFRGHTYFARTDAGGYARVKVSAPKSRTSRSVTVSYGANSYQASTASSTIGIR